MGELSGATLSRRPADEDELSACWPCRSIGQRARACHTKLPPFAGSSSAGSSRCSPAVHLPPPPTLEAIFSLPLVELAAAVAGPADVTGGGLALFCSRTLLGAAAAAAAGVS